MKKLAFLLFAGLVIFGCQPDPVPPTPPTGSMSVTLDSVEHTITTFNSTLLREVQFGEAGKRLDIRATVDGGTFILSVSNWDWQMSPEDGFLLKVYDTGDLGNDSTFVGPNTSCKDQNNASYCDGGMGTYLLGTQQFSSEFIESNPGTVTITSNDVANLTVSGLFEFRVVDFITDEEKSFKGSFLDVPYRVVN